MNNLESSSSDIEISKKSFWSKKTKSNQDSKLDKKKELIADLKSTFKEFIFGLIILGIIIGILWAYTGQMPPVVLVESNSMMHGVDSRLGNMDTGDLVLSKSVDGRNSIKTYIEGQKDDYRRFNAYGDVISFKKNGGTDTPIIHRAIVWVEYNASGHNVIPECQEYGSFDVPSLNLYDVTEFKIKDYELSQYELEINLNKVIKDFREKNVKPHGGFITKGDNNPNIDQGSLKDSKGNPLRPVKMEWILGKADGEIPWLGLIKLYITGQNNEPQSEPPRSSVNMFVMCLALIVCILMLIHFLFIHRERQKRRQKEQEEDKKAEVFQQMIYEKRQLRRSGEDEVFTKRELANFSENELLSFLENIIGTGLDIDETGPESLTIYDLKELTQRSSKSEAKVELMQRLQKRGITEPRSHEPDISSTTTSATVATTGTSATSTSPTSPIPETAYSSTSTPTPTSPMMLEPLTESKLEPKPAPVAKQLTKEEMMDILNLFLELDVDDDFFAPLKPPAPMAKRAKVVKSAGRMAAPIARPAGQTKDIPMAKPIAKPMNKPVAKPIAKQVNSNKQAPVAPRADKGLLGELMDMLDK
jgi:signal peptidase